MNAEEAGIKSAISHNDKMRSRMNCSVSTSLVRARLQTLVEVLCLWLLAWGKVLPDPHTEILTFNYTAIILFIHISQNSLHFRR